MAHCNIIGIIIIAILILIALYFISKSDMFDSDQNETGVTEGYPRYGHGGHWRGYPRHYRQNYGYRYPYGRYRYPYNNYYPNYPYYPYYNYYNNY